MLVGRNKIRGPAIGASLELWKKFCKIRLMPMNPQLRSQVAKNKRIPLPTDTAPSAK